MAANPPDDASTEALAARLEAAETTMRRQARELVELRAQVPDDTFADQLRQALVRMGAAGQVAAPVDHNDLLDLIVGTAAHVIAAQAASLYLIDRATNELVFVVALGESAAKARQFRVPVGTGIAGWVAQTGEPALVADATQDSRFAANMAQSIGYIPGPVLCLPLRSGQSLIGVIQALNEAGRPPFTENDMALLTEFAAEAAVAIEQSRVVRDLARLFLVVLHQMFPDAPADEERVLTLEAHAAEFATRVAESEQYREALKITTLVNEVSTQGPEARHLCQEILAGVAAHVRSQPSDSSARGWTR
jgi:GAF domain-containing protein